MALWFVAAVVVIGLGLSARVGRKRRRRRIDLDGPGVVAGQNFALQRYSPPPDTRPPGL